MPSHNSTVTTSWQSLQIWLLIRGLGLGLTNIPLQTLVVSAISNRAMARASSLINVTRQVFGAVGITALTTIFVQQAQELRDNARPTGQDSHGSVCSRIRCASPRKPR